jgi:hypothetical protein
VLDPILKQTTRLFTWVDVLDLEGFMYGWIRSVLIIVYLDALVI